jgi:hypothetical protein
MIECMLVNGQLQFLFTQLLLPLCTGCYFSLQVSNIFFFLVPPIMITLFASYSKRFANGVPILWIFLVIIGLGSVYFHATLSLVCIDGSSDEMSMHPIFCAGWSIGG